MPVVNSKVTSGTSVAYLGPHGTFTEQALLGQKDLAGADLMPMGSFAEVLRAVSDGTADLAFLAIENAIEGTVNVTLDALAFERELLIQREVVIDVHLNLLAPPGTELSEVVEVRSFPVALAQCRRFLDSNLGSVSVSASTSTAEAARQVGEEMRPGTAAIATSLAGELYGLEAVATDIEDHQGNQTRFVVVARQGVPAPTGHDKTSLVIYQRRDTPGSLLSILQEFAARSINLTKLESRPTRRGLGDYCFIVDLEGHVSDEVVADCLVNLRMKQPSVKFLGSYPTAVENGDEVKAQTDARWIEAREWLDGIRQQIDTTARQGR